MYMLPATLCNARDRTLIRKLPKTNPAQGELAHKSMAAPATPASAHDACAEFWLGERSL